MSNLKLRAMEKKDWSEVADLIYVSTNYWYEKGGKPPIFAGGPDATLLFCQVYEDFDPGCCVVAENTLTGRLMGSCFYHPRETHVSLGIMNAHPNYFGQGIARKLLQFILDFADQAGKPVRLVSSAMNLDSFSLYTRAGFVPRLAFQDMYLAVPKEGLSHKVPGLERVRTAQIADVEKIVALENELSGIQRSKDYRYFIENRMNVWSGSILENAKGELEGFLFSIAHPGSNLIGPGVARDEASATALLLHQLNQNKGRKPVFLLPVQCGDLVKTAYSWGAKNCELHFAQIRGTFTPFKGVTFPTFMPESG